MIRQLTSNDWQLYKEIHLECLKYNASILATRYQDDVLKTEQDWRQILQNPKRTMWGNFHSERLVSIAAIGLVNWSLRYDEQVDVTTLQKVNQERWYLAGVYNRPEFRGNGTMQLFLQYILSFHANMCDEVSLIVEVNNLVAIRLYTKLGFVIIDTLPPRVMVDNLPHEEYLMELIPQQP